MITCVSVHTTENDPGNREYKDLSVETGVEARLHSIVHMIIGVHATRSENYRKTGRNRKQPAEYHVPLCIKAI